MKFTERKDVEDIEFVEMAQFLTKTFWRHELNDNAWK
jgi:hypothetical protein